MDVASGFNVHRQRVGAGVPEGLDIALGIFDHHMDIEGQPCIAPAMLDGTRADRDRRHEVSVHDVEVDPIGTGLLQGGHLFTEPAEIGREQ